jgi:hypothetical protein
MKAIRPALFATAILLAAIPSALGQPAPPAADLTGAWTLQATFELPVDNPQFASGLDAQNGGPICTFEGTASVTQDGQGGVSGTASLQLVTGDDPPCPAEMTGTLTGTLSGTTLDGTLSDPNFGTADFTGDLTLPDASKSRAIAAGAQAGLMFMGTSNVLTGPYAGAMDNIIAISAPSVIEIPTLGTVGLVALVLLLAASAAYLLLRRRTA